MLLATKTNLEKYNVNILNNVGINCMCFELPYEYSLL